MCLTATKSCWLRMDNDFLYNKSHAFKTFLVLENCKVYNMFSTGTGRDKIEVQDH